MHQHGNKRRNHASLSKGDTIEQEVSSADEMYVSCSMLLFHVPCTSRELLLVQSEYNVPKCCINSKSVQQIVMLLFLISVVVSEAILISVSRSKFPEKFDLDQEYLDLGYLFNGVKVRNGFMVRA